MKAQIRRRTLLAAGPLPLAACARAEEDYFGRTDPPRTQRLVYLLDSEPPTLDLALTQERIDVLILSLFEGLTSLHPTTGAAMSALATHYDVTPDGLQYTFILRGHPEPQGRRLPDPSELSSEYSRGRSAPPDKAPARWSDGVPICAYDFVYSWRRALDPSTAADYAFLLQHIRNAQAISAGKLPSEKLAVRALDEFTLEIDLWTPAPFFLELVSGRTFCPVPRHVIRVAGSRWTEPGHMVTSGAFILRERRPYDRIVLAKNPTYYDASQVALDKLTFLVVSDAAPKLNLYKASIATVAQPWIPTMMPTLQRKKDFRPQPIYASEFYVINTRTRPLDDVRVRYALNTATDRRRIAELVGAGSTPAHSLVPPTRGYPATLVLPISIDGKTYDVLSFNPQASRELLAKSGRRLPAPLAYLCPNMPDSKLWAQVLEQQWKADLGVDLAITTQELSVWAQSVQNRNFRHIAESGSAGSYLDPTWFLDLFSRGDGYGSGWSNSRYNDMLSQARTTAEPALRMARLGECERYLLQAMPILPLCHDVQPNLRKPFVKGLGSNMLNRQQFKYVWIDTDWRPQ